MIVSRHHVFGAKMYERQRIVAVSGRDEGIEGIEGIGPTIIEVAPSPARFGLTFVERMRSRTRR